MNAWSGALISRHSWQRARSRGEAGLDCRSIRKCYSSAVVIERRKKLYRRERGTDVWHLLPECVDWPSWNFVERLSPGIGRVCTQCMDAQPFEIPKRRKVDRKIKG
jgi:hypothetical protein